MSLPTAVNAIVPSKQRVIVLPIPGTNRHITNIAKFNYLYNILIKKDLYTV
jgi:hypothetical protein